MCGIAGTIGCGDADIIRAMTDALCHRGPDDAGVRLWPEHGVALGHRRLSIIDLSDGGHQPMPYQDGRYWITYNGEIYNYAELRRTLEQKGCPFRTHGDTEVILAAYATWGEGCLEHFRGMFAFAIADLEKGAVFLARDRFGIKPLLIHEGSGRVLFASELRAFLASGLLERHLDRDALWYYLSTGSVPQPWTMIRGVRALLPGHAAVVDFHGSIQRQWRWWDPVEGARQRADEVAGLCFAEAAAALRQELEEATRYHLVADVPVGAFLSGGVDSAAMVGLMQRHTRDPIQTFTVGFENQHRQVDETQWARQTAEYFGTEHHAVTIADNEAAACFDDIVQALDQPSMDGANSWFVARAASAQVKVALTGLGGDELFAGYPHFRRHDLATRLARYAGDRRILAPLKGLPDRFRHNLMLPALTEAERLATLRCLMSERATSRALNPEARPHRAPQSLAALHAMHLRPDLDTITQLSVDELECYMVNTLLRDGDAMSMAHSLETRPILLDHTLAAFALALPAGFKLRNGLAKAVFREALQDVVPEFLAERPKRGFELPLLRWLSGPLRPAAEDHLNSPAARTLFSRSFLREARRQLQAPTPRDFRLWPDVVLLAWIRSQGISIG